MSSTGPLGTYGPSSLGKRGALWTLLGVGGVLAVVLLLDIYVDWTSQADPLWTTVLENAGPVLLALALPIIGWRLSRKRGASTALSEAARWCLIGGVGTLFLSGLAVSLQAFQQEIKLHVVVLHLTTLGAVGGLLVGVSIARVRASKRTAQEERHRLQNLLKGLPAPVVHGTLEGDRLIISNVNQAFEETFGHRAEEVEGKDLYELVVPEGKRDEAAELDRAALEEGPVERHVRRLTVDGPRDFRLRIAPALNHDSAETYAVYTDITKQKQRESELRLFKEVVEQATEAVLITEGAPIDEPGPRIEYVNAAFEAMTGYSRDEVIGKTPRLFQGPETDREVIDRLRDALEQGESWTGETINYRKDGTPYHLRWSVAPIRDQECEIEYWMSVQRDVTQQRRRENELHRQKHLLEQTQQLAGAWEVDLSTGAMSWSEEVYRIHEVEPGTDLSVEDGLSFYAPEARPRIRKAFERCVEDERPYDLELPITTAEGTRRWVRTVGAPLENEDGSVVKVAGAFQDITERKQAEEALQEREARLRGLANSIPGVVYQFFARPDGTYGNHFVSEHAESVLGISADPEDFFELFVQRIPDSHREEMLRSVDEAVEEEKPWEFEMPFKRPDGERLWLLGASMPEKREGELVYNGMILDITERKRQEREAEHRSDAMEAASDGMALLDSEGVYTYVNQAHAGIYGYESPEAFLGETWRICYGEEELRRFEEEVMPTLFAEGWWRGRAKGCRADGSFFPQELTLNLLDSGGLVCVVRDITEQIERERELQAAKEEAEEASRLKSAMLANMSHELRTPLTSITGFSEVLRESLEGDLKIQANKIYKGSRRLQRTLESVLHLSQLEAGVEELDQEQLCLGDVAQEVVEMLGREASEKALNLEAERPPEPVVGYWNADAVHRICRNLVENAIKFTPEGGRVTVCAERKDDEALLHVDDTGIGMDPETVPELFRAFRQESEGLRREYEGTGLGLSIVQRLTDELGGSVEVDTEKGEGSCFTVRLPLT